MSPKTVSVVGLGYIGLPTAAILASKMIKVIGVDINRSAIDTINRGEVHIIEPNLDTMVRTAVLEGYLRATAIPEAADAFLLAVPTPFKQNHEPDLSYIQSAALKIAPVLNKGNLIILESTSPVGATEKLAGWLANARPDLSFPQTHGEDADIQIAYCPERVLPGQVLRELVQNDRVVGGMSLRASSLASDLYKIFVEGDIVITNARTAEMCKLAENSFRDLNIAFANELSVICDKLGINVWELIRLTNRHPRVDILQPGPGVGGHCIAVDPWFIVSESPKEATLIRAAREVNDSKPEWVISKILDMIANITNTNPKKRREDISIAFFGLAFKQNIDDLRESPALSIVERISEIHSGPILVVEPYIKALPKTINEKTGRLCKSEEALESADIAVMLVNHSEFGSIDTKDLPMLQLDTRGVWNK